VRGLTTAGEVIEVQREEGADRHVRTDEGWGVTSAGATQSLRGRRRAAVVAPRPLIDTRREEPARAAVPHLLDPPALDGTFEGFPDADLLVLDHEDQYRRSEEPYPGPEEFSARAALGWGDGALYVAVAVTTPEPVFRPAAGPALRLDNDPDDVHSDGIQLYLRPTDGGPVYGFLIVPEPDSNAIRVHQASGTAGTADLVRGSWAPTEDGYAITVAVTPPEWDPRPDDEVRFELLVNRMEPDRLRRSGQLVWSGGGGWVYLRGDRQDPAGLGVLELR
jgi:hypothetical protein